MPALNNLPKLVPITSSGDATLDLIVCWRHDWPECPVEVIELRALIEQLKEWRAGGFQE
jgi:hypothetical protein